jgi:hypothetical protein
MSPLVIKGSVPRIVAFSFIFVGLKFYGRRSVEASLDLGFWIAAEPLWRVTSNWWRVDADEDVGVPEWDGIQNSALLIQNS